MAQAKKIARHAAISSTATAKRCTRSFPPTVEVYHELSMQRTIVEIQARDQIGLLYRLAKTISRPRLRHHLRAHRHRARRRHRHVLIESSEPSQSVDTSRLQALRDTMMDVIRPAAAASAATGNS